MQIGLFVDLRNPPLWQRPWGGFYEESLAAIAGAERSGIDSVWLTEHHFFEDGYLPQPLTFAAAVAARTERIRVGTAILIAPLRRSVDLAEQAIVVDLISDGRLELGLGAGYRVPEFDAFGEDIADRYPLLEDRATEVQRIWSDGTVTPPPRQASAPIWIGAGGPRGARLAGRLGAGLLSLSRSVAKTYLESLAEHGHDPGLGRLAGLVNVILSEDPERAWARIAPHAAYQWSSYSRYGAEAAERRPGKADTRLRALRPDVDAETLRKPPPGGHRPHFDVMTPEGLIARLREDMAGLPVHTVYFWQTVAGMADELAEEHLRLLSEVVRPALAE